MLKIAILQDSKFVTIVIVVSSSNVGSTIVINDGVSIPFLPQQVVGFKLIIVVIVKLIIVAFLVLTLVIQLELLLILLLIFKTFFFIKAVLQ